MLVVLPIKYLKKNCVYHIIIILCPQTIAYITKIHSPISIIIFIPQTLIKRINIQDNSSRLLPRHCRSNYYPCRNAIFFDLSILLSNVLVPGEQRRAFSVPAVQGGGTPSPFYNYNNGSIPLSFPEALPSWMFGTFSFPSYSVSLHKSTWEGWWRINLFFFSVSWFLLLLSASIRTSSFLWIAFIFLSSLCDTRRTDFEEGAIPSPSYKPSLSESSMPPSVTPSGCLALFVPTNLSTTISCRVNAAWSGRHRGEGSINSSWD